MDDNFFAVGAMDHGGGKRPFFSEGSQALAASSLLFLNLLRLRFQALALRLKSQKCVGRNHKYSLLSTRTRLKHVF